MRRLCSAVLDSGAPLCAPLLLPACLPAIPQTSQFEHSSLSATITILFNLSGTLGASKHDGFLTERDAWAGSFHELLTRDAPTTDYALIDGESPSTRRRSSSQGDDDPPEAPRDVEHVAITLGFLAGALAVALSVRSLGKVLSLVGATGSTTISYILPGGIYWRVGPAGPKRYLAAGPTRQ